VAAVGELSSPAGDDSSCAARLKQDESGDRAPRNHRLFRSSRRFANGCAVARALSLAPSDANPPCRVVSASSTRSFIACPYLAISVFS